MFVRISSLCLLSAALASAQENNAAAIHPPHISTDKTVKYDYDIVYVRAPRHGEEKRGKWADFSDPTRMEAGADLMLLHPDGSEEVLVSGADGSVMDPYVSFDGQTVYYAKFVDAKHSGSDIHKLHVPTRKIVRLTDQTFTPNTGSADWATNLRVSEKGKSSLNYGVFNLGPCPSPGGRIVFTSNRNAFCPPRGYPKITLQLFAMDDDGANVEQIGHLNVACALHPTILTDGRILFSTLESHGMHNSILWGIWSIRPDGTDWAPVVSAFATGGAPSGFHFQSQLSDGTMIVEEYYNLNNSGFGTYFRIPLNVPAGASAFGPGDLADPRNARMKYGGRTFQIPFTAYGMEVMTRFAHGSDGPSPTADKKEQVKAVVHGGSKYPHAFGKVTHPSGAPDNHLLTVWTAGPANHQYDYRPYIDGGIYLIREGKAIDEPKQMLLIKNDPKYSEQWPRALVPYKRIYGIEEPKPTTHRNDGKQHALLPEGTPFGLVGTSSFYKRESAPLGKVPAGSTTSVPADPRRLRLNWQLQGSDAGIYDNSKIHAVRILAQEPRTDIKGNKGGPLYANHAMERLRILGEIPLRKFEGDVQPVDPDGNPDTSFLALLPADQPFTFQTIDKDGMVLNFAQTWHQLRPGETRNNCGGCHSHSQQPTLFEKTRAADANYKVWDLTKGTPLITSKALDKSGRKWDIENETGVRFQDGIVNVEYRRDIKPILERSCVACHTAKAEKPAGGLVLDDDEAGTINSFGHDAGPNVAVPQTYFRLAGWAQFKPRTGIGSDSATRYVRIFQSRRSVLVWKLFGKRTDGWTNDDFPSLENPDDPKSLKWRGKPVEKVNYENESSLRIHLRENGDEDHRGAIMPPAGAVEGKVMGPDGKPLRVAALTDEDRRTIIRWIDLGCPIELDPKRVADATARSFGWFGDDVRPTLTLTHPQAGVNASLTRLLVGSADANSGIDPASFRVVADFAIDGAAPGTDLAGKFREVAPGVRELKLDKPIESLAAGRLTVTVKDRQGNITKIDRTFRVGSVGK